MTHKLFIAALLSAAFISPICTAAELNPASAPLGRLFFSPNQRAELDRARQAPPVSPPKAATQIAAKRVAPPPLPAPEIITVSGIVHRSDGQSTVWINKRPVAEHETQVAATSKPRVVGGATVVLPNSRDKEVKVGQSLNFRTGEISESYDRYINDGLSKRLNDDARGAATNTNAQGPAESSFTFGVAQ